MLTSLVVAEGCAHLPKPVNGYELAEGRARDLRKIIECGRSSDGNFRWRLLYFRRDDSATLYFERSTRAENGTWKAQGGTSFDPSFGKGVSPKVSQLRCVVVNDGIEVSLYMKTRDWTIKVNSDFEVELETVSLS
jgi:hypothetical protein